jgi:hypothetical protein
LHIKYNCSGIVSAYVIVETQCCIGEPQVSGVNGVPDTSLTHSSALGINWGANKARIHYSGGAKQVWVPSSNDNQWIQVSFCSLSKFGKWHRTKYMYMYIVMHTLLLRHLCFIDESQRPIPSVVLPTFGGINLTWDFEGLNTEHLDSESNSLPTEPRRKSHNITFMRELPFSYMGPTRGYQLHSHTQE